MVNHSKRLLCCLLAYAAQRDLSPEQICRSGGIDWADLHDESKPLTPEQIGHVYIESIRMSNDPLFGLHFGEALQLTALGVVGEVIKTSATVGDALNVALSLLPTITTAFQTVVTREKDSFTVAFIPEEPDWQESETSRHTLDLLMVFLVHELDGLLLKKIVPVNVRYWRPVEDVAEYQRVWRCRPTITPDINAVIFPNAYWDEKIITANYTLQQTLLRDHIQIDHSLPALQSLRSRVYDYLMRNAYLGSVTQEGIAANFNLSVRTLQRRLKEEGVTFEALADQVRKTLALNYLKAGEYPVKEVSWMLGYNDMANFTRSFKRWTGMTPSAFRGQVRER